ncbi:tRNA (guanine(26)-N(2))-dimethyltransferase [Acrasis kona]|uniref:tRNA (guanine(26)-N(2))-dimethyltransferase n=1 Tax=Acrasis kona TaxID=1008807 RepID=A0AAW2Z8K3_9EUKA
MLTKPLHILLVSQSLCTRLKSKHFQLRAMSTNINNNSGTFSKAVGQIPRGYYPINEGSATILYGREGEAFYNKVQVFNRDLSILVIKNFDLLRRQEHDDKEKARIEKKRRYAEEDTVIPEAKQVQDLNILEALSATGLRSVRYWKEIPNVRKIVANDIVPDAVDVIRRNLDYNDISHDKVVPHLADATEYMHRISAQKRAQQSKKTVDPEEFHVIDLDPYGGANPFLDSAVQCIGEGGLLCVTCTDMAVLSGQQPGACFAKYGSYPIRVKSCHEQALRILLGSIQHHCSRYGRYIVPLISLSIDFYVRVFVKVHTSQNEVKTVHQKYSNVVVCNNCENYHVQRFGDRLANHFGKCSECGSNQKISGPIWSAPIHDPTFINKCIQHVKDNTDKFTTHKRILGMLSVAAKELPDSPLYYMINSISSSLKMSVPPAHMIRSAILNAGYLYSQSHCKGEALKTNAPAQVLHDIFREYHITHCQDAKEVQEQQEQQEGEGKVRTVKNKYDIAAILLNKKSITAVDFTVRNDTKSGSKITGYSAFPPNPEDNWGPGKRARGHKRSRDEKNQDEAKPEAPESPESKQVKL